MTRKYRVAGAVIAARHLTGFEWNKERFEVPVLCSLDEDRGRALCEQFGIPEYTQDVDSLFARDDIDDIDIIDVATPLNSHFEFSERAIRAGST